MRKWCNEIFLQHKLHFLLQSLMIGLFVFGILIAFISDKHQSISLLSAIGASSLSSSAFTMFALPRSPVANPRRVIGAYFIAICCGMLWHALAFFIIVNHSASFNIAHAIAGSFSAVCAMLLMALFDFEHPPAMGFTVGLGVQFWDGWIIGVIVTAVLLLCLIKYLLRNWLISLV